MTKPESHNESRWRVALGFALVVAGCFAPFTIPIVWMTELSTSAKVSLSAFLAFGMPELLIFAALPVLGRKRLKSCWISLKRRLWRLWRAIRMRNAAAEGA